MSKKREKKKTERESMSGKKKVKRLIKDGIRCLDGLKTEMQPMQKLEGSR